MLRKAALFFSFFIFSLAAGEETNAPSQPPSPPIPSYEGIFIKMMLSLGAILALVLVTIWLLKKLSHGRIGGFGSQKKILILEKKNLSPKTLLYLIELEGKKILISESQFEVRMLLQPQDSDAYD